MMLDDVMRICSPELRAEIEGLRKERDTATQQLEAAVGLLREAPPFARFMAVGDASHVVETPLYSAWLAKRDDFIAAHQAPRCTDHRWRVDDGESTMTCSECGEIERAYSGSSAKAVAP